MYNSCWFVIFTSTVFAAIWVNSNELFKSSKSIQRLGQNYTSEGILNCTRTGSTLPWHMGRSNCLKLRTSLPAIGGASFSHRSDLSVTGLAWRLSEMAISIFVSLGHDLHFSWIRCRRWEVLVGTGDAWSKWHDVPYSSSDHWKQIQSAGESPIAAEFWPKLVQSLDAAEKYWQPFSPPFRPRNHAGTTAEHRTMAASFFYTDPVGSRCCSRRSGHFQGPKSVFQVALCFMEGCLQNLQDRSGIRGETLAFAELFFYLWKGCFCCWFQLFLMLRSGWMVVFDFGFHLSWLSRATHLSSNSSSPFQSLPVPSSPFQSERLGQDMRICHGSGPPFWTTEGPC